MRKFEDLRWRSIAKTVGNLAALRLRWGEGFMQIARGQRLKLTDIGLDRTPFTIALSLPQGSLSIDLACVGLDATRMLSDERYMSFYNQPATPCGAVKLDGNRIQIDLARLPTDIHALILTLAIDGPGVMSMLGSGKLALLTNGAGEAATCAIEGTSFADERALMLLELYRKDGAWRTCFIGQGFNGGLDALIRHFGGSVDEPSSPSTPPTLLQPLSLPPPLPNPNAAAEIIANQRILALENHIADLGRELEQAKAAAQSWTSASSNLSCDAAEARAKNQGAGHGFLGSVLGSKYRSAVRASASASNAQISQKVAKRRSEIAHGKRQVQALIKQIQSLLANAKIELKEANSAKKAMPKAKIALKTASSSIDLLHKLKEAHQSGILSNDEYQEKRRKILDNL